jgi:glutamine amidotransferase/cyclase
MLLSPLTVSYVTIPVVASSGAGEAKHFSDLFSECPQVEAALAAGIFHRNEVTIEEVKSKVEAYSNFATRK